MSDAPDYEALTHRQQATWATGDFNELARQVMPVSDELIRTADVRSGERLLDVACGSGNAAIAAARRYTEVTGIDYVPALVERARTRAESEGTRIDFRVGDAQALPFDDASFDVVVSVFGVMFAPDQEKAAAELLRVTRPGGRIALASWTPEGYGGEIFRTQARFVPPPPGLKPAVRWGTEAGLSELLGPGAASIRVERRVSHQYFHSIDHVITVLRTYFGPIVRAFEIVEPARHVELVAALGEVIARHNTSTSGDLVLQGEYLEAVVVRKPA